MNEESKNDEYPEGLAEELDLLEGRLYVLESELTELRKLHNLLKTEHRALTSILKAIIPNLSPTSPDHRLERLTNLYDNMNNMNEQSQKGELLDDKERLRVALQMIDSFAELLADRPSPP